MTVRQLFVALFVSVSLLACIPLHPSIALADPTSDLQAQIDAQNQQIQSINAEIATYQKQLNVISGQKQTLQGAVNALDISLKQLTAQISLTQKKIGAANLHLQELGSSIQDKEGGIALDKQTVAQALRTMNELGQTTIVEYILNAESITEAWETTDHLAAINSALAMHAKNLASDKIVLTNKQAEEQKTKQELSALASDLATQKKGLDISKQSKVTLLNQTKNSESSYQALIATKKAQEKVFENTLSQLQSQLKSVGTTAIPVASGGILAWPYSATFAATCPGKAGVLGNPDCVTQFFGNTSFAQAHSTVYNNGGHDGIDIGMPVGTPLLAALSGVVMATGNTDVRAPSGAMCYSFGKWVVLKHANGLATLYAHLSDNTIVKTGQAVVTGQLIGYSGMTGYATGPHLHFGVYAVGTPDAPGIQIMSLAKFRGTGGTPCTDAGAILPVAPTNAYLNPMLYL